jgi:hypothetical protein
VAADQRALLSEMGRVGRDFGKESRGTEASFVLLPVDGALPGTERTALEPLPRLFDSSLQLAPLLCPQVSRLDVIGRHVNMIITAFEKVSKMTRKASLSKTVI